MDSQYREVAGANSPSPFRKWGLWAVLLGALALALVFFQIAAPSFEPKPSVGAQIGEIAGEIKRSAWRTFLGLPKPAVKAESAPLTYYLSFATPILGIVAILLSLISGILRENWRYAAYGVSLGATAIVFQYFWWLALVVAAVVLLVAIIENIGDIFSF
ncbi:hypothetical protein [Oricola indica]|uniref:hypothetical protein n=1 Tax=Oricola indica TaxID=2872591 RepID=UPI003CCBA9FF